MKYHPAGPSGRILSHLSRLPAAPLGDVGLLVCAWGCGGARPVWYFVERLTAGAMLSAATAAAAAGGPLPDFLDAYPAQNGLGLDACTRPGRRLVCLAFGAGPAPAPPPAIGAAAVLPSTDLIMWGPAFGRLPLPVANERGAVAVRARAATALIAAAAAATVDGVLVALAGRPAPEWWYVRSSTGVGALYAAAADGLLTPPAAAALAAGGTRLLDGVLSGALLALPAFCVGLREAPPAAAAAAVRR